MKRLLFIIGLLFSTCGTFIISAQQEDIAKFVILEAKSDGVDVTDWYISNKSFIVFYQSDSNEFCMANVCPGRGTQSYGSISQWESRHYDETSESYEADVFTFRWSYENDYDSKTGSALCKLTKIYKNNAVAFELSMITEDMSQLDYKGYMEGSLNL